ncbi:hypothetical protein PJI17_31395, partial [Mycobacterium kansasii]
GNVDSRKLTLCYLFVLVRGAIRWMSKFWFVVALFTTKAGYMAVIKAFKEGVWLMGMINQLGLQ